MENVLNEKIYTIPVLDAFKSDCECPLCSLEQKLEDEALDYTLGPSMMEPDSRTETNIKGFCKYHFKLLYNQNNRLGLALIISTHIAEINNTFAKSVDKKLNSLDAEAKLSILGKFKKLLSNKVSQTNILIDILTNNTQSLENSCVICEKLSQTMSRYMEVVFVLWKKDDEFKELVKNSKGYCLHHFKMLLESSKTHLNQKQLAQFLLDIIPNELESLKKINADVQYFTQKFDYKYKDAPWGNSKDSVQRSINKLKSFSRLE